MRITEKILLILIVLAILAKLVPIPLAGLILTLSAMTLSFIYALLGFAIFTKIGFRKIFNAGSYKHLKPLDIIFSILTGWAFSSLTIGILFQLQYWPNANIMSLAGMILTIPILILAAFLLKKQNRIVYMGILKRGIPLVLFVLVLYVLPTTTKLKIFKIADPEIEAQILKDANESDRE